MADEEQSLLESLDLQQLNCLNENTEHNLKEILALRRQNKSASYLLSDADEQLLLNIPSIVIRSSGEPGQRPRTIKLFINRPSLGFDDVQDAEEPNAAQIIELTDDQVEQGKKIPLRFVRFQNVASVHIFVATNGGDDETRIDAIDIFGSVASGSKDLSALREVEEA
ncbi:DUF1000-domain-containing protein [Trametopsis cervina]|nr:DUF1000-domain-containing protein [Trametopsis cervina]